MGYNLVFHVRDGQGSFRGRGALCGAAIAGVWGSLAGAAGAVAGTLGGRAARARLAAAFGSDRPAAFLEDAVAIGGAFLIIWALR